MKQGAKKTVSNNKEKSSVGKDGKAKTDIKVHKCVLAYRSPMFRSMFKSEMKKKAENRLEIEDFVSNIAQAAIIFCYDQNTYDSLKIDGIKSLLEFIEKYDI
uniref:BTB domain-containing protein n=1 Tax=Panagrolaimus sp. ES5 TaxID=591445 RepID=A0AC34F329_9BILA